MPTDDFSTLNGRDLVKKRRATVQKQNVEIARLNEIVKLQQKKGS